MHETERFIRDEECQELTGLSRVTRWRMERAGDFPKRRQISPNAIGWLYSELADWMRSRPKSTISSPEKPNAL